MSNRGGIFNQIGDGIKNAWNRPNNAVIQLILINAFVFLVMDGLLALILGSNYFAFREWLKLPPEVLPPDYGGAYYLRQPWSILTYSFLHGGLRHIFWNMLGLFWFGRVIEEFLGGAKVIILYVLGALAGGFGYLLLAQLGVFEPGSGMVGASAGIFAVMIGAAVLVPNYQFNLILIGPVKIIWIALVYFLLNFYGMSAGANVGGQIAHIGGAVIGYFYVTQLQKGTDFGSWIISSMNWIKNLFKPKPKIRVTYRNPNPSSGKGSKKSSSSRKSSASAKKGKASSSPSAQEGETSQEEIDAILDKISDKGYESLSKEEKQKLFNASNN